MTGAQFTAWLGVHLLQVLAVLAVVRLLDRHEREPLALVGAATLWGAVFAIGLAAPLNLTLLGKVGGIYSVAVVAPPVEEATKGLAVVALFALSAWTARRFGTREFGGVTDGIVYGAAIGLGFGFLENIFYFVMFALDGGGEAAGLEVFLHRIDLAGLGGTAIMHATDTAIFGAALGLASLQPRGRRLRVAAAGYALAVAIHAMWNGLPTFLLVRRFGEDVVRTHHAGAADPATAAALDVAYWEALGTMRLVFYVVLAGIVAAFAWWQRHEGRVIAYELHQEPALASPAEVAILVGWRSRTKWYLGLLRAGQWSLLRALRRYHEDLVEFALARWRARVTGEGADLERRRTELVLSRQHLDALAALERPLVVGASSDPVAVGEPRT